MTLISTQSNNAALQGLHFSDLVAYLQLTGWKRSDTTSNRWFVFEGAQDVQGEPLEIVLPQNGDAADLDVYLVNAVELLAALGDTSVEAIISKIRLHDRDILRIRNLETQDETTISLELAYRQVREIRRLLAVAAFVDRNPRPYFRPNTIKPSAYRVADMYRFGHTFAGSFGLTIECPITNPVQFYQPRLFTEQEPERTDTRTIIPPIERRVMERIIRGLVLLNDAPQRHDMNVLLNQYIDGFNGNMCQSVAKLLPERRDAIEFTIDWSSKIAPPDDIQNPGAIRLSTTSTEYLDYLAGRMRQLRPERVNIQGYVESLTSRGNPKSRNFGERMIIVRWINRPEGRPVEVVMRLQPDDYMKALEAHKESWQIEVSGELSQASQPLRLANPQDFKVVNRTTLQDA